MENNTRASAALPDVGQSLNREGAFAAAFATKGCAELTPGRAGVTPRAVAPIDRRMTARKTRALQSGKRSFHLCELRHITLPRIDLLWCFSLDCDPSPMAGSF